MGKLIPLCDADSWSEALSRSAAHDIYHTAAYHRICTADNHREAFLYVGELAHGLVLIPLLINPAERYAWSEHSVVDATTAYGYPGPLLGAQTELTSQLQDDLRADLRETLGARDVVALFIRMHPLLSPAGLLGNSEYVMGKTVWIDLAPSVEDQRKTCRKSHRYELRKAWRNGVSAVHDERFAALDTFVQIYDQRMAALNASAGYFFSANYYRGLVDELGAGIRLVHAMLDDKIIGSSLFFLCGAGIQYHLSGTLEGYESYSPTRVILESMREWGTQNNYRWLHLGGGVNSAEDSLFRFKAGFSPNTAQYRVGKFVVDEARYGELCRLRNATGSEAAKSEFFPAYRG